MLAGGIINRDKACLPMMGDLTANDFAMHAAMLATSCVLRVHAVANRIARSTQNANPGRNG